MKKVLLIIIVLIVVLCAACTEADKNQATASSVNPSPLPSASINQTSLQVTFEPWANYVDIIPSVEISWEFYETFSVLCKDSDVIATATVMDVQILDYPDESLNDSDYPFQRTLIKYTAEVDQSYKGDFAESEIFKVYQTGWRYGDINIYHKDTPPLDYDKTYLMFIYEASGNPDAKYLFCIPFESYPQIIDGKLVPHERSRFFYNGQTLENAFNAITEELTLQEAPGKISASQGVQYLIEFLSQYPDQTPIRKLKESKFLEIYDSYNCYFVQDFIGMELENGDMFIWIETSKLLKHQQENFEKTLNVNTKRIAKDLDEHFKVTCTPFHSIITICDYNEDNATIHDAFQKIVSGEWLQE